MVHKIRKYENRQNSIVFGCCAASFNFILLWIDNDGNNGIAKVGWSSGKWDIHSPSSHYPQCRKTILKDLAVKKSQQGGGKYQGGPSILQTELSGR
jgi:hypothetical protein